MEITKAEIAAIYNVMNFVKIEGYFHLETEELAILEKLESIIEKEEEGKKCGH